MSHTDPAGYPPQSGGPADAALDAGGLTEELRQERLRHQLAEREAADLRDDIERLIGLLRELLHIAANGFMAPEARRGEVERIKREAGLL